MNSSVISKAIELRDPTLPGKALTEIDLLLRSTADLNEKVYLLFSKSSCLGILGNFDEARQQLTLALQQGPDDPEIRLTVEFNEGLLCQQQRNYSEALKRFSVVLSTHAKRLSRPELRFMRHPATLGFSLGYTLSVSGRRSSFPGDPFVRLRDRCSKRRSG